MVINLSTGDIMPLPLTNQVQASPPAPKHFGITSPISLAPRKRRT
uniref:Uncharacterized protein n=1 Tax=Anguilla anguilla TaxID=7936 RepID=A0A0E9UDK8_ANGAN